MKNITISILFCFILIADPGSVSADKTINYNNAKMLGAGGTHIANGYNYNGFIHNPALLSRVRGIRFSIGRLPIGINKDLLDLGNFIDDNVENFEQFGNESLEVDPITGEPLSGQPNAENRMTEAEKEAFLYDLEEFDGQWSNVQLSPMAGLALNIKGFGIGLAAYNITEINLKADKGIYDPRVWGQGRANTVVALGVAKPFSIFVPGLIVGANFKYVQRNKASLFTISASKLGDIEETIKPVQDELKDNSQRTFMVDLGAMYTFPFIDLDVAGVFKSLGDGRGSSVDLGVSKTFMNERVILLADYIDFTDNNKENIFNKIRVGAIYDLSIIAFRAGMRSGYPSLGCGIDLGILDLDAAYYTQELSKGPGGNGEDRYVVQFQLGW